MHPGSTDETLDDLSQSGLARIQQNLFDVDSDLPTTTDVIIVGAGPAGLLLAYQLSRMGINYVILDHNRLDYPQDQDVDDLYALPTQGILLNAESSDVLHTLGLMQEVITLGRPVRGATIFVDGQVARRLQRFEKCPYTRFQTGICVEQWKFERCVCGHLRKMNQKIYRQHVAYRMIIKISDQSSSVADSVAKSHVNQTLSEQRDIRKQPGDYRVKVFVKKMDPIARKPHPRSEGRWVNAKYVVGADGVRSMTRRALEIEMESLSRPCRYLVADFKAEYVGNELMAKSHYQGVVNILPQSCSTDSHLFVVHGVNGSGVFIPFPAKDHWRMMICKKNSPNVEGNGEGDGLQHGFCRLDAPSDEDVKEIITLLIPDTVVDSIGWRTAYSIDYMMASQVIKERGILIGDAARFQPPIWSSGLNCAIHDSFALAWRLAAVIEGTAIPALLETFDEEQRAYSASIINLSLNSRDRLLNVDYVRRGADLMINRLFPFPGLDVSLNNTLSRIVFPAEDSLTARHEADRGVPLTSVRVLGFPSTEEGLATVTTLDAFYRDNSHVLLLLLRVFPLGFRRRTLFGCEKKEILERYSKKDLDDCMTLARGVEQIFIQHVNKPSGKIKVVWVICGLIDSKAIESRELTLSHAQVVRQIPPNLKSSISNGSLLKCPTYAVIDHDCHVQLKSGLDLSPGETWLDEFLLKSFCQETYGDLSKAFVLLRPDGKVAVLGHVQDSKARSALDEYTQHFFDKHG